MKIKKSTVKFIISIVVIICTIFICYFSFPLLLRALSYIVRLFLPFILGYAFAAIVKPVVRFLQNKLKIPKALSAIIVMILILGIAGSILGLVIYKIVEEVRNFYYHFPMIYANIKIEIIELRDMVAGLLSNLPEGIQDTVTSVFNDFTENLGKFININSVPMVNSAGTLAKALPRTFIAVIVFLLSSFFMVCDFELVSGIMKKTFKGHSSQKFERVKNEIKNYLGGYVKAQGIIMTVAFVIMLISFRILGVEYGLLIAMGVALLDALPFFGSGAALWPWSILSFINGDLVRGFGIIITYVIIVTTRQLIEPKIISTKIGTHPLLTLMAMYTGYKTFSIGGMILGPVILMLVISFYKAGVFDGLIRFLKGIWNFLKYEFLLIKNYIKKIWESEE